MKCCSVIPLKQELEFDLDMEILINLIGKMNNNQHICHVNKQRFPNTKQDANWDFSVGWDLCYNFIYCTKSCF